MVPKEIQTHAFMTDLQPWQSTWVWGYSRLLRFLADQVKPRRVKMIPKLGLGLLKIPHERGQLPTPWYAEVPTSAMGYMVLSEGGGGGSWRVGPEEP